MILKDTLRELVKNQREMLNKFEYGIEREVIQQIDLYLPFAIILSGVRRCGKSILLLQLIRKRENYYFFNFEDPRIVGFEVSDFQKLNDVFQEEFGTQDYYFFDEIQNVQGWEIFIRSMLDKGKKIVITGSNASLLSKELGTRLTGRHLRYELFPFSYTEMLTLLKINPNKESFEDYLKKGGFPEFLKNQKEEILRELFYDIVIRDIVVRHKIRNLKTIKELGIYLLTNIGKEFSYNNLKKTFNLGSINTVISFISFFEDSYLLFTVPKFSYSFKQQLVNPKKIYSIDNGLSNANSVSFSSDKGRMLENVVFNNLRKKFKNIFYFKETNECDFVVKEKEEIVLAIQVCYELNNDNKERELNGLLEALIALNIEQGLILTFNIEDQFVIKNKKIFVKPTWKWLLE